MLISIKRSMKYRNAKVRATLVMDAVIKGVHLKAIRFVEVTENDEFKKEKSNVKDMEEEQLDKDRKLLTDRSNSSYRMVNMTR